MSQVTNFSITSPNTVYVYVCVHMLVCVCVCMCALCMCVSQLCLECVFVDAF